MTISLYDSTVPTFIQGLKAIQGLLSTAEAFCSANEVSEAEMFAVKLAEDMLPFAYQVKSVMVHSLKAIEGVRAGTFSPDMTEAPTTFDTANTMIADTIDKLGAVDPSEFESYIGKDMVFAMKDLRVPFTAENFLFSFSKPNFYFHLTTAYALMRAMGVPLGKRDFMGPMLVKTD